MDPVAGFLLYAALFRLAVITAGVVSIVLGFRLFVHDVAATKGTEADLQAGGARFQLRNAAPGTCFALFGAVMITVMVINGRPELTVENLGRVPGTAAKLGGTIQLKSGDESVAVDLAGREAAARFDALVAFGRAREQADDTPAAIAAYGEALALGEVPLRAAAEPLERIAWLYQATGRAAEAEPLARLAVRLDGAALATLARVLLDRGELVEAEHAARRALETAPDETRREAARAVLDRVIELRGEEGGP